MGTRGPGKSGAKATAAKRRQPARGKLAPRRDKRLRDREGWAARIEQIDAQVGRIVAALQERDFKSAPSRRETAPIVQ